ncbi:MAG: hypothetical protein RDV48_29185 [Candidatus Eremiobacteraeota bacterium]|nr:hypothetical protein [Candidatus Eremiobacteraeota bacterium]
MDRITPGSPRYDTPQAPAQKGATAGGSPAPADRVSLSPKSRPAKGGARGSGKASSLELFFRDGPGAVGCAREAPSKDRMKGKWTVTLKRPFGGTGTLSLDNGAREGAVAFHGAPGGAAPGRIIRADGGWIGESVIESNLPYTLISRSKMIMWLGDDGAREMTFVELWRDGGGAVYELDAESYFAGRCSMPPMLKRHFFEEGETPPVAFHASAPRRELSSLDSFFGGGTETARPRWTAPSAEHPEGAWNVSMRRHSGPPKEITLKPGSPEGERRDCRGFDRAALDTWERAGSGWQSSDTAKATPENFDTVESASLKTVLDDEGFISMILYESYMDGGHCAFALDGMELLKNPSKAPPVLAKQYYGADHPLDGAALKDEALRKKYGGEGPQAPAPPHGGISEDDEGQWILIDGLRIPVKNGGE